MRRAWIRFGLVWAAILVCGVAAAQNASAWRPAKGPLATRWTKDVRPDRALPEYPRPQMVRPDWMNLNGLWDYAITGKDDPAPTTWDGKILVPFPVESALSGVMKPVTPSQRLWYHRRFTLPGKYANKRLLLHFGAVDWDAAVSVNGKQVGAHRGGYDPFTFDITGALKSGIAQDVVVSVWDGTGGIQSRGKQTLRPEGIFYTPTTGIWQTVWLEPVPRTSIEELRITPDTDAGVVRLTVNAHGDLYASSVQAVALAGGTQVAKASGPPGREFTMRIPEPRLWSPDRPFLYDLRITLRQYGRMVDSVASYFGMRKVSLGKGAGGFTRILLNNQPVFQVGPLDQGFWPDGIYTAPTDEALRYDLQMMKRLGMNAVRKHVKVEPDRWYYWCDKLGLLVWQDMPAGDDTQQAPQQDGTRSPESAAQFERELRAMVETHYNHPSIIMWVVFNEAWGQYDTVRLTKWVKELDPSRLVNDASGWTDRKAGDVMDMHNYPGPGCPPAESARAAVLGEFGGLGLGVDGHTWTSRHWGYQAMSGPGALTDRFVDLLRKAYALRDSAGLCACIYTQITDVETECSGLMTYDRDVLKVDESRASAAARGLK